MALQVKTTVSLERTMDSISGGGTTDTRKDFPSERLGAPSSLTRTVRLLVVSTCSGPGVQVNTPERELMVAPAGALVSRLNVRMLVGISGSVAVFVKMSVVP